MDRYLVTPKSKKDLVRVRGGWKLPVGSERYRSLRRARVWIKRNVGRLNLEVMMRLPGQVRVVSISGAFTL